MILERRESIAYLLDLIEDKEAIYLEVERKRKEEWKKQKKKKRN